MTPRALDWWTKDTTQPTTVTELLSGCGECEADCQECNTFKEFVSACEADDPEECDCGECPECYEREEMARLEYLEAQADAEIERWKEEKLK